MRLSISSSRFVTSLFVLASASSLLACSDEADVEQSPAAQTEPAGEDILARGAYVGQAVAGCYHCHSEDSRNPEATVFHLSGMDEGIFVAPNITQDMETGIGAWSDAEIENALRKGKRPDGTDIHPVMPWKYYANLTPSDMSALIEWLRSQEAISRSLEKKEIGLPVKAFAAPLKPLDAAEVGAEAASGSYLTGIAHCMRCHTPVGADGINDYTNQLGAGGKLFGPPDATVVSLNLTPHPDDGIDHYTNAEVIGIIRTGQRPDDSALAPIMGARPEITDTDLAAIVAYLRTLPPKPFPDLPNVSETSD